MYFFDMFCVFVDGGVRVQRRREVSGSGTATAVAVVSPREARKNFFTLIFFCCLDGLS